MSAKKKRPAPAVSSSNRPAPSPPAVSPDLSADSAATAVFEEPFYKRHPKIANVIFVALCIYVAMIWLLALDQTFHWGIFGPKVLPMP